MYIYVRDWVVVILFWRIEDRGEVGGEKDNGGRVDPDAMEADREALDPSR